MRGRAARRAAAARAGRARRAAARADVAAQAPRRAQQVQEQEPLRAHLHRRRLQVRPVIVHMI